METVKENLINRHLDTSMYNGVYIDENERVATFLLWNLSGMCVGYQQYRPDATKEQKNNPREGRYFTYVTGKRKEKMISVWGLESLDYRKDIVVVCEGIFDACRFHNHRIPAIATLSSDVNPYKQFLASMGRRVLVGLDDHATRSRGFETISPPKGINDFGDCTEQQMREILCKIN